MSNVKIINCYFCNLSCNIGYYDDVGECNNCSTDKIKVYKTREYAHIYHYSYDESIIYRIVLSLTCNKTEIFIKKTEVTIVLENFPVSPTTSLKTIDTYVLLS